MEYFEGIQKQLSEITTYDIKNYYNKAKNAVMNYTEMEAKVREATNDDTWGTSSTAMQEIADATYDFQHFNEIMGTIYKRFTEKEAREWRQIYKALVLLEYIVKNGSERVVDDARSHVSIVKILRNFHYIDEKGKDQGLNVRNRAKEIAELLGDVERIRSERKKSKASRSKYIGAGHGGGRYGGFGNEFGATRQFGGGFREEGRYTPRDESTEAGHSYSGAVREEEFEEYDAGDWDDRREPGHAGSATSAAAPGRSGSSNMRTDKPQPAKPEVNLFDLDDDEPISSVPSQPPVGTSTVAAKPATATTNLDDDFDDFQGATPTAPASKPSGSNNQLFDMLNTTASTPQQPNLNAPPVSNSATLSSSFSSPAHPSPVNTSDTAGTPMTSNTNSSMRGAPMNIQSMAQQKTNPASQNTTRPTMPSSSSKPFDDIWALAGGSNSSSAANNPQNNKTGQSLSSLAQQKTSDGLWGNTSTSSGQTNVFNSSAAPKQPWMSSNSGTGSNPNNNNNSMSNFQDGDSLI